MPRCHQIVFLRNTRPDETLSLKAFSVEPRFAFAPPNFATLNPQPELDPLQPFNDQHTGLATRWTAHLLSKVNLPRVINFKALRCANIVTLPADIRGNETCVAHRVGRGRRPSKSVADIVIICLLTSVRRRSYPLLLILPMAPARATTINPSR